MTNPSAEDWPAPVDAPAVALLDAQTPLERRVLDDWLRRQPLRDAVQTPETPVVLPDPRAADPEQLVELDSVLGRSDDPRLVPLRVVWLPGKQHDGEPIRFRDVIAALGDPRHPHGKSAERALRRDPPGAG